MGCGLTWWYGVSDSPTPWMATLVEYYNTVRLHSALGDIIPDDMLNGLVKVIHDERDHQPEKARQRRQLARLTTHAMTKPIAEVA